VDGLWISDIKRFKKNIWTVHFAFVSPRCIMLTSTCKSYGTVVPVHATKAYWGSTVTTPLILNLNTRWTWATLLRLGGRQSRSGRFVEDMYQLLVPGFEPRIVQPVTSHCTHKKLSWCVWEPLCSFWITAGSHTSDRNSDTSHMCVCLRTLSFLRIWIEGVVT